MAGSRFTSLARGVLVEKLSRYTIIANDPPWFGLEAGCKSVKWLVDMGDIAVKVITPHATSALYHAEREYRRRTGLPFRGPLVSIKAHPPDDPDF